MSSQKGNLSRTRGQKHQNTFAYKNDLHNKSKQKEKLNNLEIEHVCQRCKDTIQWKIKYGKYKPLSQPKTCTKCSQKTIKDAYHTLCNPCGDSLKVCCKCQQSKEIVPESLEKVKQRMIKEAEETVKFLSERKRRTFYRYMNNLGKKKKKSKVCEEESTVKEVEEDNSTEAFITKFEAKLQSLIKNEGDDFSDEDNNSCDDDNDSCDEEQNTCNDDKNSCG